MYVHHTFLYLILTRQVEGKGVGAGPKKTTAKNAWASFNIFPFARGSVENADKAQNFLLRKSDVLFYPT
jgi:hypothetical protein